MCAQLNAASLNVTNLNVTTAAYGKPPFFEYAALLISLACLAQSFGA